jgi:hypothetical protein
VRELFHPQLATPRQWALQGHAQPLFGPTHWLCNIDAVCGQARLPPPADLTLVGACHALPHFLQLGHQPVHFLVTHIYLKALQRRWAAHGGK